MTESLLKDRPITIREALIPYFMTAVNMLSPILAAMSLRLLSKEIVVVALSFTLVGIPMSIFFRQQRYNKYLLNILTMVPLIFISWSLLKQDPAFKFDLNNPIASLISLSVQDAARALLRVFVLLGAGRAFVLVTSRDLSESPIPGIAIFLLTAATNPVRDLSLFFFIALLIMLISSLYLLAQDHIQQWFTIHTPFRIQRRLMKWALVTTIIIFPLSLICSLLLSPINFQTILRKYQARHYPSMGFGNPFVRYNISNDDTISMGSIDWPQGNQEMLRVEVEDRTESASLLWRSATYARYENNNWLVDRTLLNTTTMSIQQIPGAKNGYMGSIDADPGIIQAVKQKKMKLDDVRFYTIQKVTMLTGSYNNETPLFGAMLPWKLFVNGIDKNALRQRYDGNLLYNQPIPANSEYIIVSLLKPSPTEFVSTVKLELPKDRQELYLQMPSEKFTERIRKKALEILKLRKNIKTDYDKIQQLSIYLSQNYSYTLSPESPKGTDDPILSFLETGKKGYCVYFSGAFVMLCRSIGLPARMATGFATGDQETSPSPGRMTYLVKSSEAHAWAEVFLPNYGWLTIDPTAGSIREIGFWESLWDNIVSGITNIKNFTNNFIISLKTSETARWYALLVLLGIITILGSTVYFTSDRPPLMPRKPLNDEDAEKCVMKMYSMMLLWFKHWRIYKPEGATATEFDILLHKLSPDMAVSAGLVIDYYLKGRYASASINNVDACKVVTAMREIWRLSKVERKRIYEQDAREIDK